MAVFRRPASICVKFQWSKIKSERSEPILDNQNFHMAVSRFTSGPGADTWPRGNSGRGGAEGARKRQQKWLDKCWINVG